jgi:hypothetical protein
MALYYNYISLVFNKKYITLVSLWNGFYVMMGCGQLNQTKHTSINKRKKSVFLRVLWEGFEQVCKDGTWSTESNRTYVDK